MTPQQRRTLIEKLGTFIERLDGQRIDISEALTFNLEREYDRHATLYNRFEMQVRRTGWQMSGGHIYLFGENSQYGFFSGYLSQVEIDGDKMVVHERFESQTGRKTTVQLLAPVT